MFINFGAVLRMCNRFVIFLIPWAKVLFFHAHTDSYCHILLFVLQHIHPNSISPFPGLYSEASAGDTKRAIVMFELFQFGSSSDFCCVCIDFCFFLTPWVKVLLFLPPPTFSPPPPPSRLPPLLPESFVSPPRLVIWWPKRCTPRTFTSPPRLVIWWPKRCTPRTLSPILSPLLHLLAW